MAKFSVELIFNQLFVGLEGEQSLRHLILVMVIKTIRNTTTSGQLVSKSMIKNAKVHVYYFMLIVTAAFAACDCKHSSVLICRKSAF